MKTSASQFETMIDFMERNGDLNKPADGPQGRLRNHQLWEELVHALNLDFTGDAKSLEKWKKVWSDYKSNIKKKAAKINQEFGGTGGGPSSRLVLSDLEQRVINIIGPQSVTGLNNVPEVGLEVIQPPSAVISAGPSQLSSTQTQYSHESSFNDIQIIYSLNTAGSEIAADADGTIDRPSLHRPRSQSPSHVTQSLPRSRSPLHTNVTHSPRLSQPPPRPTQRPRRQVRRPSTPPLAQPLRDEVAMRFEEQDERWRLIVRELAAENFRIRERELEEQTRLRERELQQQAFWQELAGKCLDLMSQYLNKK